MGRNWIGLEQFVRWSFDHVVTKAASIDASAVVDLYHVEQYGETQVLAFLDKAVNDVTSAEHASLYEFLLAVFTEVDSPQRVCSTSRSSMPSSPVPLRCPGPSASRHLMPALSSARQPLRRWRTRPWVASPSVPLFHGPLSMPGARSQTRRQARAIRSEEVGSIFFGFHFCHSLRSQSSDPQTCSV